jgi:hypothetical protein
MYKQFTQSWQYSNVLSATLTPSAPAAVALADLAYQGADLHDFDPADYLRPIKGVRVG